MINETINTKALIETTPSNCVPNEAPEFVIGTAKVLEAARKCLNLKAIINVTSDKCYENEGYDKSYTETDPMGGFDPYSSSKGCAELVASSYRRSFLNELGISPCH